MGIKILYLCDGKQACNKKNKNCYYRCNDGLCMHTSNPNFAKNFVKKNGIIDTIYVEKPKDSIKYRTMNFTKHSIITLLGSRTKFKKEFLRIQKELTFRGFLIMCLDFFNESGEVPVTKEQENILNSLMKQKIEMAEAVFVINPDGYIGENTKKELELAKNLNKHIVYYDTFIKTGKLIPEEIRYHEEGAQNGC